MTTIHLLRRQPGKAYLDGHLWLPKTHFRQEQVSSVLTYVSKNGEYIEAWEETDNHFKVPRNFLDRKALGGLPFPVVDARFTQFPTASLRSRVTLGSRNPGTAFQQEGADALLRTYDGILCLRCGAGKTVVALHAASQLNTPVLIVVNDRGLARQWAEAIETFLGVPPDEIGRIGGDGSPFDWKHDICIALVQTLASRASKHALPAEVTQHFGVVILDEAHIMGAPYFNTAIPPFQGRRWGLTATPTREDAYDSLLRRTVGPVVYTYLKPDLVPTVYFKALNTTLDTANPEVFNATHDKSGEFHYGMTYGYLAREDTERTATIATEIIAAIKMGRQVLVLTHSRDMVEALSMYFPDGGVCHGDVPEGERLRRIRECNPVIAIMQLGKQALDKPSLDTLFVCEPVRKEGVLQQIFGRVLRTDDGKKAPVVIFLEDVHIKPLSKICNKIRKLLSRWPQHKGGRINFKRVK